MSVHSYPPRWAYQLYLVGEMRLRIDGCGAYSNVVEVYEYDQVNFIVGRRYTAVDRQDLVDVSFARYMDDAILVARRLADEPAD